jgi:multicomponent Na+:H+ antiporter subunit A
MDSLYENWFLKFLIDGTAWIFARFQSGYLRHYLMIIAGFLVVLVGYTLGSKAGFSLPGFDLGHLKIYEYALAGLIVVAAIATVIAKERLAAIISLGVVGALVVAFWVIYSAPDLALTQLLIEIVTVVLFVLVFFHALPFAKVKLSRRASLRDGLVALAVGGLITTLMLVAIYNPFFPNEVFPSLPKYFIENAEGEAGARNIVNVIIVDFRGYDTMGEITVLSIAVIALFCLHKLRKKEKQ